jgi:hypothetical protein
MLPYFTLSSVVGMMSGTTSGMMPEDWKAERTSAARAAEMLGVEAHVDWRSLRYGDAFAVEAAKRRERKGFMMTILILLVWSRWRWKHHGGLYAVCVAATKPVVDVGDYLGMLSICHVKACSSLQGPRREIVWCYTAYAINVKSNLVLCNTVSICNCHAFVHNAMCITPQPHQHLIVHFSSLTTCQFLIGQTDKIEL